MNSLKISFHGGAETVTGSKFLIQYGTQRILVDSGLFQGIKKIRNKNWNPPGFNPELLDAVVLTHGHLDHTGYLPRLKRLGLDAPIYGTKPTLDIAEIILKDSAKIQEEKARKANKEDYSQHDPAKPLYNRDDAQNAINLFTSRTDQEWHQITPDISYRHRRAGHILGATFIEMNINGTTLTFSGDLGRPNDPIMAPPQQPSETDYLILESTYGDRIHPEYHPMEKLQNIIQETVSNDGTVLVPSFAVERAQLLMYFLRKLRDQQQIPRIPMYLDTPMGQNVSELFHTHTDWHKLDFEAWKRTYQLFDKVESFSDTRSIAENVEPKLVIAGSGMVTGGRILHYLSHYLRDQNSTLILTGYQAEGTRGRKLQSGMENIKFHGSYVPVQLRVEMLEELSAHADRNELLSWASHIPNEPDEVFLVHGERQALDTMRLRVRDRLGWTHVSIPELHHESVLQRQE